MKKIILLILLKIILCNYNLNIKCLNKKNQINFHPNTFNKSRITNRKKHLMMSLVIKYSFDKIMPFLKSLIKSGYENCDIVFFINQISQITINYLISFGIILCEIPGKLDNRNIIYKYRWKFYGDYLIKNKEKYDIVLSVDIRDTIFQNEFFKLYENYEPFIAFSYENATLKKLIDKEWIINTFGYKIFKKIEDQRIINAGTIWGTSNEFCEFSNLLFKKLLKYFSAIDQAVVNYLIYYEKIMSHCVQIKSDENGPVLTLGLTKRENIILDDENNILNNKGHIAPIVHQYDRHPDLKKIMKNKFCPELTNINNIIIYFIMVESFTLIILIKILNSLNRIKKEKRNYLNRIKK